MIRSMRVDDAHAVWEMFCEALGYGDCDEALVRRRIGDLLEDERQCLLVWVDERDDARGFLHAERYDTLHNEGGWNVIALAVLPTWQGRGVGGELLAAFESWARGRDGRFVRLNSSMSRTEAHRFYEQRGYASPKTQRYFVKRLG